MTGQPEPPRPGEPGFRATILAGGASRRMGTDKSFVLIEGEPLVSRLVQVLGRAGAAEVLVVGGDIDRLRALGVDARPDSYPGEGPLGGLITALGLVQADRDWMFVTACDHPALDPRLPAALLDRATDPAEAVIPVSGGARQVLAALYRSSAREQLLEVFSSGERSLNRGVDKLEVTTVEHLPVRWFTDLDTPDDLYHYAAGMEKQDPVPLNGTTEAEAGSCGGEADR